MRQQLHIAAVLLTICIVLCGCPYSSNYQLDDAPGIYTEDIMLGNWATTVKKKSTGTAEPVKMMLSRKTDTEYGIAFTGYIDELRPFRIVQNDTITGTAFMSTADKAQILNIKIKGRSYVAELKYEDGKLSLLPLSESFTAKMILSNAALRSAVEFHFKTRANPSFDEDFCLRDMVKVN